MSVILLTVQGCVLCAICSHFCVLCTTSKCYVMLHCLCNLRAIWPDELDADQGVFTAEPLLEARVTSAEFLWPYLGIFGKMPGSG